METLQLKSKIKTVIEVNAFDLDAFVKSIYGTKSYSFIADNECGNDSVHTFTVVNEQLEDYEQDELNEWKENDSGNYMTSILLQDLCINGHIQPGEYIISVCW